MAFGFGTYRGYGYSNPFKFPDWFGHGRYGGKRPDKDSSIELSLLGTFDSGLGEGAAEIVAHDSGTQRLFVTNSETGTVDILDISDPKSPSKVSSIDVSVVDGIPTGGANSVAVSNGIVAVALEASTVTDPGMVAFYDTDGALLGTVEVGALPDMLTFTPDGTKILVANEGEADGVDPKGSVSIIDISGGVAGATVTTADFTAFDASQADLEAAGLRIFEGKLLSDDVEPEYIAVSEDGKTAFITLQEANAVAVLDIEAGTITEIQPLGAKDHSQDGAGIDPSDRDGGINIQPVPVSGLYMPDAIASYDAYGKTFYVTANEGDARDEDARVEDLTLDPDAFPDAATLQAEENLGRLEVSTIDGDTDGDGDYDQLFAYGARSFTIWDEDGNVVFDSGDMIEQTLAELTPELFNANDGDPAEFDARSDAKGPEPESVVIGEVDGHTYAFVGLERAGGGIMVFDISKPHKVSFKQYIRTDGDIAPEGLEFIAAEDSPTGSAILAVANEVSGTTSLYQINFEGKTIKGSGRSEKLFGTGGDDSISGRSGNDKIFGKEGNDDLNGDNGRDMIYGGFGDDDIDGGKHNDKLFGDQGDDRITGGRGNDEIDGGDGTDTAVYSGNRADYEVNVEDGTITDLRSRGSDGTDTFENIEFLEFADETVDLTDDGSGGGSGDTFTLQILHASDLEGGLDAIGRAANFAAIVDTLEDEYENSVTISAGDNYIPSPFFNASGDAATFNNLFEGFYNEFFGLINLAVVDPAADTNGDGFYDNGELDAFILANGLAASDVYTTDINGDGTPDYFDEIDNHEGRADITIMNAIGFDASALGNHEFDVGSDALENIINYDSEEGNSLSGIGVQAIIDEFGVDAVNYLQEVDWPGAQFPYLSANLDFSADSDLGSLFTGEILLSTSYQSDLLSARANPADPAATAADSNDSKIAPATIIEENGEFIGVVGATTQLLESLSSPTGTTVAGGPFTADDMAQLASVLQPVIDDLMAGDAASGREPVNKIILTSHLQQIALEQELAGLLNGVDVILAGGSDTLLADATDTLRPGDVADGDYPLETTDAAGNPVLIVSTDGEYSYVGRLVVEFDADGNIIPGSVDAAVSGAYVTDDDGVVAVTGAADAATAIANSEKATDVANITSAVQGVVIATDSNVFGETDVFIDGVRTSVRTEETNMGNLTADANLAAAQSVDDTVLVSIKNGGGIRAPIGEVDIDGNELPPPENPLSGKEAGEISQLDIENTLRFNNALTLITLTPEQLLQVLEHAVSATAPGATPGQFAQVGGVSFSFDPDAAAGSRVQSVALVDELGAKTAIVEASAVVSGAPSAIRIVTLNFLADGGDSYPYPDFVAADAAFANRVDLNTIDPATVTGALDGNADFATFGTEQDALAEYLAVNHPVAAGPDGPSDFMAAETAPAEDTRIQNLSVRADTVLDGAGSSTPTAAAIYDIQGAGHRSPHEGILVQTSGIVTAIAFNGFYMQDPTGDGDIATSDGIFVLGDTTGLAVGDAVDVEGSVAELQFGSDLSVTRIEADTTSVTSSGNALPDTVVLGVDRIQPDDIIDDDGLASFDPETDAIDFLESLEGMRVEVNDALVVGGTNRFDEVTLAAGRGSESGPDVLNAVVSDGDFNPEIILTDDILAPEPVATTGDTFASNPVGVLDYTFGAYKLQLTETPVVVSGGRTAETTALTGDDTHLTIATYNTFNLDPGDSAAQFAALASSIVSNLGSPDILALQEIQDNTGSTDDGVVDASATLTALIDAITAAGGPTYAFAQIDPVDNADGGAPGSNIRNAFLYNADRVDLDETSLQRIESDAFEAAGDGTVAEAAYEGTRKPLVGDFTSLPTGETVTVIGNHLKSKTQDDGLFGENQPPIQNTLAQRVDQAEVINAFVADLQTADADAKVVVLGDLNDFQFSDTLAALANGNGGDAELINLIDSLPTEEQYSFIFNGNSQQLDHILVSSNIAADAPEVDVVHVNLDYGFPSGNASDHDPVVALIDLSDDMTVV